MPQSTQFLDYQVVNSTIEAERDHLRVGDHFVRVLTMKEAITETRPLVLDSLLKIGANFDVVTEWTPMNAEQARKEVNKRRRHFNVSKTGFISQMGNDAAQTNPRDVLVDESKQADIENLGDCLRALGDGQQLGDFSLSIALYGRSKPELEQLVGEFTGVFTNADGNLFVETYISCGPRASEVLGLQWKSWTGTTLVPYGTAFEGQFYPGRFKTRASQAPIGVPEQVRPIIQAWHRVCPDPSPEALMFSTFGRGERKGQAVPRWGKNFLTWWVRPITRKLKIPDRLVTFQVMRRTLGTNLQHHGTLKDAQGALRHASIQTTGDVYVQTIEKSVLNAMNSRTAEILTDWEPTILSGKNVATMDPATPKRRSFRVVKHLDQLGPSGGERQAVSA